MNLSTIDQISEVPSDIMYIKRFISRICGTISSGDFEFYIGFSLEKKPVGLPDVVLKYIDPVPSEVLENEARIVERIRAMEKSGELKHSPFEGL